jgi:dihydroorotate dehydrogenase (NAD+) catalytic subunit
MPNLEVTIAGIKWKNPVTVSSGTFSAKDSGVFYDISILGAIVTKGISIVPWEGNPTPRIAEVYGGMLNSIGIQNSGVEQFCKEELPYLKGFKCPIIVNVAGKTIEEYCGVVERLNETQIDMMEINISCPNVKEGGIGFGTSAEIAGKLTKELKSIAKKPLIMKLSPNVTDITEIAKAVESEGADCVSLINTMLGMKIDVRSKRPVLAMKSGGFSGPAIKPIAVRMIYQVREAIDLPIIGMGGIMNGEDAAELMLAGADAIAVGTAGLVDPASPARILKELEEYMVEEGLKSVEEFKFFRESIRGDEVAR